MGLEISTLKTKIPIIIRNLQDIPIAFVFSTVKQPNQQIFRQRKKLTIISHLENTPTNRNRNVRIHKNEKDSLLPKITNSNNVENSYMVSTSLRLQYGIVQRSITDTLDK